MKVRFRLAEILDEFRVTGRGIIKKICEETGLERHQVSALLKNEVRYLSLNSLGAICDYLINTHHMNSYELPGKLFALEPEDFWAFLSEKQLLVMSFGVRQEMHDHEVLWVPASDSFLQGTLLHELYGSEVPTPLSAGESGGERQASVEQFPRFDHYMVRSCSTQPSETDDEEIRWKDFERMKRESKKAYDRFHKIAGNKALVCIGSIKSNGLCELVMAHAFSTDPWVSEDGIASAAERKCPVYFRFRARDVNVDSCQGGRNLAKKIPGLKGSADTPGVYFECEPGRWDMIPSTADREPAMILYSYQPTLGVVEVVLGGFSTQGTFLLAENFRKIVREIWPPTSVKPALETGLFVVDFQLKPNGLGSADTLSELGASTRQVEKLNVIRLPESVLEPRLSHADAKKPDEDAAN